MATADAIYLAVITVLIIAAVCALACAHRADRILGEVKARYGLNEETRPSLPRKGGAVGLRRYNPADLLRPRTYEQYRREVNALVERARALEEFGAGSQLADACWKALDGGKRIRPIILLEVARAASVRLGARRGPGPPLPPVDAGEAALAVEYLHAASLVVDDLPAFDNDLERRGRPTLHAEVGAPVAQMAALALVAGACQNLCRQIDWVRDNCPAVRNVDRIGTRVFSDVSRALGASGAAKGQSLDVSRGAADVASIARLKTASFFEIATVVGWLVAGGEADQTAALRLIGAQVGTAFQIADDISDAARDAARAAQGKPGANYALEYGAAAAAHEVERQLRGARLMLQQASLWTPLWGEIFGLIRAPVEEAAPNTYGESADAPRAGEPPPGGERGAL